MTPQPHPLRCDTCKNRKGHYDIPFCDFWDKTIPITKYGMDLIAHIGCASHSDARRQQPDALAELEQQISARRRSTDD